MYKCSYLDMVYNIFQMEGLFEYLDINKVDDSNLKYGQQEI